MNISERGSVCIDVLKNNWSPALSLYKVILSLSSLLTDPNPRTYAFILVLRVLLTCCYADIVEDPLGLFSLTSWNISKHSLLPVPSIAKEYSRNRRKHDATAREWTSLYAKSAQPAESSPKPAEHRESRPSSSRIPSAPPLPRPPTTRRIVSTSSNRPSEVISLESDSEAEAEALIVSSSPAGGARKRRRTQAEDESRISSPTQPERRRRISGPEDGVNAIPTSRAAEVIEIED